MRPGFLAPVCLALLVSCPFVRGADPEIKAGFNPESGLYHFQYYSPKTYGALALPQNWASARDGRGVLYFGNSAGVLQFDGSAWRLIPLGNGSIARSLAVGSEGLIYAGGVGDFGFIRPDATGTARYTSLTDKLPAKDRAFRDVWRTFVAGDAIYFGCDNWLARYQNGSIRVWHPERRFGKAFAANGEIFVVDREKGLLRLRNDQLTTVDGGAGLAKTDVYASASIGGDTILGADDKLYKLGEGAVTPFPTSADKYLAEQRVYSLAAFPGNQIAVGTRKGGLLILDRAGKVDRMLGHNEGLLDAYVTSILDDGQGGIWLTQFTGIAHLPAALTTFGDGQGLPVTTSCVARSQGSLYAGTSSGMFRLTSTPGALPHFERVAGVAQQVFMLLSWGDTLLAAASDGVYEVSGGEARRVYASAVAGPIYYLAASPSDPSRVYAAGRDGLAVLRRDSGQWTRTGEAAPAGQIFRTVAEDSDGTVWAGTTATIWHFDFRATPVSSASLHPGTVNGHYNTVIRWKNRVVFGTARGLLKYSPELKKLVPDSSLGTEFTDGLHDVYSIWETPRGDTWVTGAAYHGFFHDADGKRVWTNMPLLGSEIRLIYDLQADSDGVIWACGEDQKLFRWESGISGDPNRGFHALTRQVSSVSNKSPMTLYGGEGPLPAIDLSYRANNLRFEFAAPFYEAPASVEFQYRLEGVDKDWSRWTTETKVPYQNLWEGSYQFHLRARNPHGVVSEESVSDLRIAAPFYRSWWAYTIYAVLAVFVVWGIVRLRTRELEKEKVRLEGIVEERTVEIRQQRDEIHVQERKSHSLLLNILPAQVADELKSTGAVQPVGFDDVTVCFTDFVGFTLSSEKMPPADLVDALNEYFTAFDEIIARYGLEKLKTIGDSYMFVSGLPERRSSHAVDAVLAAMEMVQVVKRLAAKTNSTGWNIRVGLHSGPVVAGVVGIRKFAFDIWGNTVNFAARMESSGVPGSVNMSERTCRLTRGLIECEGRGHVRIKEGRELLMFLARGVAADFAQRYEEEFGEAPRTMPEIVTATQEKALRTTMT